MKGSVFFMNCSEHSSAFSHSMKHPKINKYMRKKIVFIKHAWCLIQNMVTFDYYSAKNYRTQNILFWTEKMHFQSIFFPKWQVSNLVTLQQHRQTGCLDLYLERIFKSLPVILQDITKYQYCTKSDRGKKTPFKTPICPIDSSLGVFPQLTSGKLPFVYLNCFIN